MSWMDADLQQPPGPITEDLHPAELSLQQGQEITPQELSTAIMHAHRRLWWFCWELVETQPPGAEPPS